MKLYRNNNGAYQHGYVGNPLYYVHQSMIARCENPNHQAYANYGGRGITVSDEWHNMNKFGEWAYANGYESGLSIDRINNDGNYEPQNCKWSTRKQQAQNRRTTKTFQYNGEILTAAFIREKYCISKGTFFSRLNNGWSIEQIIETPINNNLARHITRPEAEAALRKGEGKE